MSSHFSQLNLCDRLHVEPQQPWLPSKVQWFLMSGRKIFVRSLNKTSSVDLKQQPHFHFPIKLLLVAIPLINFMCRANLWCTLLRRLQSSPLTSENDSIFELCAKQRFWIPARRFPPQQLQTFFPSIVMPVAASQSNRFTPSQCAQIHVFNSRVGWFCRFFFFLSDSPIGFSPLCLIQSYSGPGSNWSGCLTPLMPQIGVGFAVQ